jgi:hypothetical protein
MLIATKFTVWSFIASRVGHTIQRAARRFSREKAPQLTAEPRRNVGDQGDRGVPVQKLTRKSDLRFLRETQSRTLP